MNVVIKIAKGREECKKGEQKPPEDPVKKLQCHMRRWKKMQNYGVIISMVQLALKLTLLNNANKQQIYNGVAIGTLEMARVRLNKH